MKKKKNKISCCSIPANRVAACSENVIHESLGDRVKRMKSNMYMTKENWEEKRIIDIETGMKYSYRDIDELFNN